MCQNDDLSDENEGGMEAPYVLTQRFPLLDTDIFQSKGLVCASIVASSVLGIEALCRVASISTKSNRGRRQVRTDGSIQLDHNVYGGPSMRHRYAWVGVAFIDGGKEVSMFFTSGTPICGKLL